MQAFLIGILRKYIWRFLLIIGKEIVNAFNKYILGKKQEKQIGDLKKAESYIDEANKIADQTERLKKKAEAAREMQDAIKPH